MSRTKTPIGITLDKDLLTDLKREADALGRSLSWVVEDRCRRGKVSGVDIEELERRVTELELRIKK